MPTSRRKYKQAAIIALFHNLLIFLDQFSREYLGRGIECVLACFLDAVGQSSASSYCRAGCGWNEMTFLIVPHSATTFPHPPSLEMSTDVILHRCLHIFSFHFSPFIDFSPPHRTNNGISLSSFLEHKYSPNNTMMIMPVKLTIHQSHVDGNPPE